MQWTVPTLANKKYKFYITWPEEATPGAGTSKATNTVVKSIGHDGANYIIRDTVTINQGGVQVGQMKSAMGVNNTSRNFQYCGTFIANGLYAVIRVEAPVGSPQVSFIDGLCVEEIDPVMGYPGVVDGQYDLPYPTDGSGVRPPPWPQQVDVKFWECGQVFVVQGCGEWRLYGD